MEDIFDGRKGYRMSNSRLDVLILIRFPHCLRDLVKEAMDESTEKPEKPVLKHSKNERMVSPGS